MIEACAEEGVSPEMVFFISFFCCCLFDNEPFKQMGSRHKYFMCEGNGL